MSCNNKTPVSPVSTPTPTAYVARSTGLWALIPSSWVPYAELMRLDRPAGFYAFFWHYGIGLSFAACISKPKPSPIQLAILTTYFAFWVLFLRGAVCTWNDNLDQEFDRKVTRTRFRPIARGAVSTAQAHVFTLAQVAVGAVLLVPLPLECAYYAATMTAILAIYPLGKRFTDFPQMILGLGLAMPIFFCSAALEVDPSRWSSFDENMPTFCLYAACYIWTVIFDTVYAHQDAKDDVKAGVRSFAVLLGGYSKTALSVLAAVQVLLLTSAGVWSGFSVVYFGIGCGGAAATLAAMIVSVELDRPESCAWWFGPGSGLVGASVVLGLLGEYLYSVRMAY